MYNFLETHYLFMNFSLLSFASVKHKFRIKRAKTARLRCVHDIKLSSLSGVLEDGVGSAEKYYGDIITYIRLHSFNIYHFAFNCKIF